MRFKKGERGKDFIAEGKKLYGFNISDEYFIEIISMREEHPKILHYIKKCGIENFDKERFFKWEQYWKDNPNSATSSIEVLKLIYGENYKRKRKINPYNIEDVMEAHSLSYEEAKEKVEELKAKTSVNLNHFIKKYGEEEGRKRFEEKCKLDGYRNTLEGKIALYGEEEGKRRYEKQNARNAFSSTLEGQIALYGEEEGRRRYEEQNKQRRFSATLEGQIAIYGEEEGRRRYEENSKKKGVTKEALFQKYGEEKAQEIIDKRGVYYRNMKKYYIDRGFSEEESKILSYQRHANINRCKPLKTREEILARIEELEYLKNNPRGGQASKESLILFNKILYLFEGMEVFIGLGNGNTEYRIYDYEQEKMYYYDLTVPALNLIIEYDGEAVHPDPSLSEKELLEWTSIYGVNGLEQFKKDKRKQEVAIKNGFTNYIRVRKNDYKTAEKLIKEIECVLNELQD